jgi:hypothetical protein
LDHANPVELWADMAATASLVYPFCVQEKKEAERAEWGQSRISSFSSCVSQLSVSVTNTWDKSTYKEKRLLLA